MYKIIKKRILSPTIKLMEVYAPKVAKKAQAGQFVIIRIDEKGERIPLTIADYDRERGTITIVFQEVGRSTMEMGILEEGDSFLDFVGPLGLATEIEDFGKVVCIGGGVGIAPIYPIAKALKKQGNEVISIIGARTKELLFFEDEMRAVSSQLFISTDDGSYCHKGFVTDLLKKVLEENDDVKVIWAIGPVVMMKSVAELTRSYGVKTIVSMNPIMVDGTGMCGACRVSVDGETKFACVDGPEFDGHKIDWDLAVRRLATFKNEEKEAMEHFNGGGGCGCQR
ncbi:MAG: sulfide/dihydroorotate dehydrogenase-like FAD/NAD-binding protein [Bacillota bacterium]